jgi:hypothetical protein
MLEENIWKALETTCKRREKCPTSSYAFWSFLADPGHLKEESHVVLTNPYLN